MMEVTGKDRACIPEALRMLRYLISFNSINDNLAYMKSNKLATTYFNYHLATIQMVLIQRITERVLHLLKTQCPLALVDTLKSHGSCTTPNTSIFHHKINDDVFKQVVLFKHKVIKYSNTFKTIRY